MSFATLLKKERENLSLSREEAAELMGISELELTDRENAIIDVSKPELVGLLVCLGISFDDAIKMRDNIGSTGMSKYVYEKNSIPFVEEDSFQFIFSYRFNDDTYEIGKDMIHDYNDIVKWVNHLSVKRWVTKKHIVEFVSLAFKYLSKKA